MIDRWHYTTGERWEQIRASGVIRLAMALGPRGERPVVWFSRRPIWEPTATTLWDAPRRVRSATDLEIKTRLGGRVRIGVESATAPYSFADWLQQSGVNERLARGLVDVARGDGADPADWFVSFTPVPSSAWRSVEWWLAGSWEPTHGWVPEAEREAAPAE